jgi:hypothetical protein
LAQYSFSGSVTYNPTQVLSNQEVIDNYLQGVVLSYKNKTIASTSINFFIESAQSYIERILSIKLNRQLIEESHDLYYDDWQNWGFLHTNLPVACAKGLDGYLGKTKLTEYPEEWINVTRTSDASALPSRQIRLMPNSTGTVKFNYSGYFFFDSTSRYSYSGLHNNRQIPNYWNLRYVTGWEPGRVPPELINVIGKLAAIQILTSVGEIQFALIGVNSQSLSLDGLSQSLSTVAGMNHPFSGRIKSYGEQVTNELKMLLALYKQPIFAVF